MVFKSERCERQSAASRVCSFRLLSCREVLESLSGRYHRDSESIASSMPSEVFVRTLDSLGTLDEKARNSGEVSRALGENCLKSRIMGSALHLATSIF